MAEYITADNAKEKDTVIIGRDNKICEMCGGPTLGRYLEACWTRLRYIHTIKISFIETRRQVAENLIRLLRCGGVVETNREQTTKELVPPKGDPYKLTVEIVTLEKIPATKGMEEWD